MAITRRQAIKTAAALGVFEPRMLSSATLTPTGSATPWTRRWNGEGSVR